MTDSKPESTADDNFDYEASIKRLEQIVQELEEGDLPLDQTLRRYEEGKQLDRLCGAYLDGVEKRVLEIMDNNNDATETRPYGDEPTGDPRPPAAPDRVAESDSIQYPPDDGLPF